MPSLAKLVVVSGFAITFALNGTVTAEKEEAAPAPSLPLSAPGGTASSASVVLRSPGWPGELPSSSPQDVAARAFAADVVRLSGEADGVDRLWRAYKADCGVRERRQYDFGRAWFALWDRSAEPTVASPACSGILWRLLESGEGVRRELLEARAAAKRAELPPGTEIGMLRWNGLQWP